MIICWVVGTLSIWIQLSLYLADSAVFRILPDDWTILPLLLLGYAASSGLGFAFGVMFLSWLVVGICRRVNGAPHQVGECVMILSGPHLGETACIESIMIGQGNQPLLSVSLGTAERDIGDHFLADYEVIKVAKS